MICQDLTVIGTRRSDKLHRAAIEFFDSLPQIFLYIEDFRTESPTSLPIIASPETGEVITHCEPGDTRHMRALIRKFLLVPAQSDITFDERRTIYRKRHPRS